MTPAPPPLDLAALDLAALDLAALKEHAQSILRGENISEIEPSDVLALIARVTAAESSLARYIVERTRFGDAMAASAVPAVVGAIMRELTTDSDERAREATARAEADRKNAQWFGDRAIKADTRAALAEAKLDSLQMFGDLWRARAEAAEAKIAAVRELHRPVAYRVGSRNTGIPEFVCEACHAANWGAVEHPCPTIRALGGQDA